MNVFELFSGNEKPFPFLLNHFSLGGPTPLPFPFFFPAQKPLRPAQFLFPSLPARPAPPSFSLSFPPARLFFPFASGPIRPALSFSPSHIQAGPTCRGHPRARDGPGLSPSPAAPRFRAAPSAPWRVRQGGPTSPLFKRRRSPWKPNRTEAAASSPRKP